MRLIYLKFEGLKYRNRRDLQAVPIFTVVCNDICAARKNGIKLTPGNRKVAGLLCFIRNKKAWHNGQAADTELTRRWLRVLQANSFISIS